MAVVIGLDYQLSPHFNFGQMTKTENRLWINKNREIGKQYIDNLSRLCNTVIEPVYNLLGPLIVNSCFRCTGLNKAIGGALTSQHCDGEALDFETSTATEGLALKLLFDKIVASNIQYSQLILEFDSWIHIGLIDEKLHPGKKMQKMFAKTNPITKKTEYIIV